MILNDVACDGDESSITECSQGGFEIFAECINIALVQCGGKVPGTSKSVAWYN